MSQGLKLEIGGDVKEAEKALKDFVDGLNKAGTDAEKAGDKMAKSFGAPLTKNLTDLNKTFASLKSNLSGVRFTPISPQFTTSVKAANDQLQRLPRTSNAATLALINVGRVAQDAPFGFLGIANNLNPLLESFQRLKQQSGSTSGALKALGSSMLGAGGIGIALSVVSSLLIVFGKNLFGAGRAADDSKKRLDALADSIKTVTSNVDDLTNAISFQNQLGAINVQIADSGNLQDLKEQSVAQQQLVADLGREVLRAQKIYGDAQLENQKQKSDDSKKIEQDALKALQDVQKKERDERQKGIIIFRQIDLQRKKDAEDAKKKEEDLRKKNLAALKKYIDDAKRLASELEKIGFLQPQFSFFDSFATQLIKARKVFGDFNAKRFRLDPDFFKIEGESAMPRAEVEKVLNVIEDGVQKGIIDSGGIKIDVPFSIETNMSQNARLTDEFKEIFMMIGREMPKIDMDMTAGFNRGVFLQSLRDFFKVGADISEDGLYNIALTFAKGIDNINTTIDGLKIEALAGIGEAIGTALAGGDIQNVFKGFVNVIGDSIQGIGKQFIAMGVLAKSASKALAKLFSNPWLTIAVGVGLVAVGAALKASMNKGVTGFAQGGIVSGPTMGLIGEGINTTRSNPEVIAPLDQLRGMLADMMPSNSGVGRLSARIRGGDLILATARTNASQGRLGVRNRR